MRVRREWFYYGSPRTPENLCFGGFMSEKDRVAASTNVDWCTPEFRDADPPHPAVEIV